MARDYKAEYRNYHGTAEQKANRAQRNAARRLMEREHGDIPRNKDVDHVKPIRKGGTNAPSNLRVRSQKANRGWRG